MTKLQIETIKINLRAMGYTEAEAEEIIKTILLSL